MKRLTLLFVALGAFLLTGCASTVEDLGKSGAFEPATCYDSEGRQWTGTAACQELARAQGEAAKEEAKADLVASIQQPTTDDPAAWDKYYEAVEDGPLKASIANGGGGGAQKAPVVDQQAELARTALVTESNEKQAWIGAGASVATGGLSAVADIIERKFAYKEKRAMWAAYERPHVSVKAGSSGGPGVLGAEGEEGVIPGAPGGGGTTIVNVDGATATGSGRAMSNRDGYQSGAHDDAGAVSGRNVTDPTQLTGVCDEGDSQCDGETFLQQQNPTNVDPSILGGRP